MGPSLFSSSGNASSVKYFEIRVDQNILVLRGSGDDSTSALLRGTLVLCLTEPIKVQDIHMRLTGEERVAYPISSTGRNGYLKHEGEFFRHSWTFENETKGSQTLPAGNYEYPFELILPGGSHESVEGLPDSWIVYRMKATIDRGLLASNVYTRKHIRVIRTFDPTALELAHAMSVENVWPDKLTYSIETPSKAVVFGSKIQVDFRLIPLLKGLRIGDIRLELVQTVDLTLEAPGSASRLYRTERAVAKEVFSLPDHALTEDIDGQDGYRFTKFVQIPKSLRDCVQTVQAGGIKVRHKLKFVIALLNPDGHLSELRALLPVHVFLSPNIPITEDNTLVALTPQQFDLFTPEGNNQAPPIYGQHQFDQLYSDMDPSGYMTPAGLNGRGTPHHGLSRTGSFENLSSMDAVSSNELLASNLENRLSSLSSAVPSRWNRERYGSYPGAQALLSSTPEEGHITPRFGSVPRAELYHPSSSRPNESDPLSRRHSAEDGSPSPPPQHIEFNSNELSKVPSYNTAVHTPSRTPYSNDLPNYQLACNAQDPPPMATPRPPNQAYSAQYSPSPNNSPPLSRSVPRTGGL